MQTLNRFFADTLGVLFRAVSGRLDPWTKQEIKIKKRGSQ